MSDQKTVVQRGIFQRMWRYLFGYKEDEPPTVEKAKPVKKAELVPFSERRNSAAPLVVPAAGGLLDFSVDYELIWSASVTTQAKLNSLVEEFATSAEQKLRTVIWPVGRLISPFRPDEAETAMNNALEAERANWCYARDSAVSVSCRAQVFVRCDSRVAEQWLPAWRRMAEMDAEKRVSLLRLDIVSDLLPKWRELLNRFDGDPAAVQAARLVDPEVATVLAALSQQRTLTNEHLIEVLRETADGHRHVGLFEFATTYDRALRSFERQAGLTRGTLGTTGAGGDSASEV